MAIWNYLKKRIQSFGYAFRGIEFLFRSQAHAQIHLIALTLATFLGVYFRIQKYEWMAVIGVSTLVLALEAMNTAIEQLTDLTSPDYHPLAGKAKDVAAAAVLIAAFGAAAVGVWVFGWRVLAFFQ